MDNQNNTINSLNTLKEAAYATLKDIIEALFEEHIIGKHTLDACLNRIRFFNILQHNYNIISVSEKSNTNIIVYQAHYYYSASCDDKLYHAGSDGKLYFSKKDCQNEIDNTIPNNVPKDCNDYPCGAKIIEHIIY